LLSRDPKVLGGDLPDHRGSARAGCVIPRPAAASSLQTSVARGGATARAAEGLARGEGTRARAPRRGRLPRLAARHARGIAALGPCRAGASGGDAPVAGSPLRARDPRAGVEDRMKALRHRTIWLYHPVTIFLSIQV